jgi:isocitrate dehydrogenase
VTIDAANAIKRHGVGVKCATITPDEARVEEFGLKKMWRSPNGTIRNILGGVVFREPIIMSNVPRLVPGWTKPIIIGRHAHGDQYKATDFVAPVGRQVHDDLHARRTAPRRSSSTSPTSRPAASAWACTTSTSRSATSRAPRSGTAWPATTRSTCPTKNTILKAYDGRFKDLFAEIFETEFADGLRRGRPHLRAPADRRHGRRRAEVGGRLRLGLQELRRRRAVRHGGPGLRLARPDDLGADDAGRQDRRGGGRARHGHPALPQWQKGEKTSTNPIASIFAWTGGLKHRGVLDGTPAVTEFAESLEQVCVDTVEAGQMTKDLALLISRDAPWLTTDEFMNALDENLRRKLA